MTTTNAPPASQYLRPTEVAKALNVDLKTLRLWRAENRGPRFVSLNGIARYPAAELAEWIAARTGGDDA